MTEPGDCHTDYDNKIYYNHQVHFCVLNFEKLAIPLIIVYISPVHECNNYPGDPTKVHERPPLQGGP